MKRERNFYIILVSCFLCISVFAFSGPKKVTEEAKDIVDIDLEDMLRVTITTASKKAEELEDAPGSLTVISRQQIEDSNARTLRDVLNVFVPGMDVVPTYFRYGDRVNEGIYSRGLLSDFSQQVLILYNGRTKYNETTFGSAFPAIEFTLDNIERIEVSRSPIPLYGGNAINIINLITRDQSIEGVEGSLDVSFDSDTSNREIFRSRKFSAVWGKNLKKWHVGLSLQYYNDFGQPHPEYRGAGDYAFDPDTLRDGTKAAGNMSFSVDSLDKKISFQTEYRYINQDAFLSGQVPSQSQDLYNYEGTEWHCSFKYNPSAKLSLTVGSMISKFKNFIDFGGEPYGGEVYNYDLFLEGNYNLKFEAGGDHSLLTGLKIEREGQYDGRIYLWNGSGFNIDTNENSIFAPNESRTVYALMVEDQWKVSDIIRLVGGLRLDYFDGYREETETVINPRLALIFKPSSSFVLKGLFATATRPPSIYERLGTALLPLKGSSQVKSEKVRTFELSAIYKSGGFKLQVTPFFQVFDNKIEYMPGSLADEGWFVATNSGKTEVLGIDVEMLYYFTKRSYFALMFSKFKSKDKEIDHDTFFIPDIYVSGVFNWNFRKLNLNINAYYRGKRILPDVLIVNTQLASDSHFLAHANVSYNLSDWLSFFVLVENVTNAKNYVPLSVDELFVPLRRRTIHAGIKVNFK